MVLSGCGGGSTPTVEAAAPAVSLSATSLTFSSGLNIQSAAQTVTITDSGTAELTFSGITVSDKTFTVQANTCGTGIAAGTACTITLTFTPTSPASVNASLSITDNASGSPHTVSLTGTINVNATASLSPTTLTFTGVSVGSSSSPQTVTLTNNGSAALTITNVAATGNFSIQTQTTTCGASVGAGGNCTISVIFMPQSSGTLLGTLTVTDNAGGLAGSTQTVALSGSNMVANTAQLTVGFGPNGPGPVTATSEPYFNGIFTSVTVCEPGTTTCQSVPNVLVDTGSVGLRVLATALGNVSLPTISLNGQALNECVGFVDFSYSWGPVAMATVEVGGETASGVPAAAGGTANTGIPIQIISNTSSAPSGAPCITSATSSYNANTVALLGANGILGVGNTAQDCTYGSTNYCDAAATSNAELYITCTTTACSPVAVPLQQQVWNPVAAFSSGDTNGESLQLPSIPAAGAASATGTMTFGIGTQSNNAMPAGTTVYEQDAYNYFATVTYNGVSYNSSNSYGSYIDSGSNGLYVQTAPRSVRLTATWAAQISNGTVQPQP